MKNVDFKSRLAHHILTSNRKILGQFLCFWELFRQVHFSPFLTFLRQRADF